VRFSDVTDGFRLAYDRTGDGPPVLLLHGWPGDRADYREMVPLLWPAHDPLFPAEWSDRLAEFFGQARLRMLPSAGHLSPLEAPGTFAEEIRAAAA
jgi:pimeloyl-ACP methyl ester carboxylesterase